MAQRVGMEASVAIGEMVRLANADVVAAYPITPQTHIVEHLAELVANGELDAEYIPVESEHSAMSACLGASAAGARAFTATAGQGLELMHEVLYMPAVIPAGYRYLQRTVRRLSITSCAPSASPKTRRYCCRLWFTWMDSTYRT